MKLTTSALVRPSVRIPYQGKRGPAPRLHRHHHHHHHPLSLSLSLPLSLSPSLSYTHCAEKVPCDVRLISDVFPVPVSPTTMTLHRISRSRCGSSPIDAVSSLGGSQLAEFPPSRRRSAMMVLWLASFAQSSGVLPALSLALTSAPLCASSSPTFCCPYEAARWSGVSPYCARPEQGARATACHVKGRGAHVAGVARECVHCGAGAGTQRTTRPPSKLCVPRDGEEPSSVQHTCQLARRGVDTPGLWR